MSLFRLFKKRKKDEAEDRSGSAAEVRWDETHDLNLFREYVGLCLDELPEAFFKELSGGVLVSEQAPVPEYARRNDLLTLGHYKVGSFGRQVVIYYGSFVRMFPYASNEELLQRIRGVVRHEFRHHMEFLSGIHNSKSLEAEDLRQMRAYLDRR